MGERAVAVAIVATLAIGGCGGGDSSHNDQTQAAVPATSKATTTSEPELAPQGVFVSTGIPGGGVGRVIVNQVGQTLYHFAKDKRNSGKTACYGACTKIWIPYVTRARPRAMLHARASLLGTIKRRDGSTQVTYAGLPVYFYASDGAAQLTGSGKMSFGARWYPLSVSGQDAK